jgi:hypothetical protein
MKAPTKKKAMPKGKGGKPNPFAAKPGGKMAGGKKMGNGKAC